MKSFSQPRWHPLWQNNVHSVVCWYRYFTSPCQYCIRKTFLFICV